jgi:hypothetical protein
MKTFKKGEDVWYHRLEDSESRRVQQGRLVDVPSPFSCLVDSVKLAPFYRGLQGRVCTVKLADIVETSSHMHHLEHLHACNYDVEAALSAMPQLESLWSLKEKAIADNYIASRLVPRKQIWCEGEWGGDILFELSTFFNFRKRGTTTVHQLKAKLPMKKTSEIVQYYFSQYVVDSEDESDDLTELRKRLERESAEADGREHKVAKLTYENADLKKMEITDFLHRC